MTRTGAIRRLLAAGAISALALVAVAAPASAGGNLRVDVNLVIVGTAPTGTIFTVHYVCTGGQPSGDFQFDAAGNPLPADSNFFNTGAFGTTCTISETATGGAAAVAYACTDVSNGVNATCAASGDAVTFDSPTMSSAQALFTVTNTFVAAADPVIAGPLFTG